MKLVFLCFSFFFFLFFLFFSFLFFFSLSFFFTIFFHFFFLLHFGKIKINKLLSFKRMCAYPTKVKHLCVVISAAIISVIIFRNENLKMLAVNKIL